MTDGIDPFSQLVLERRRTLFMFYGFRSVNGKREGAYFKHAHSLGEALADLEGNAGIADEGGYLVRDAFVEDVEDDGGAILHVELISTMQILEEAATGGER
jgi:hypothetical protein